MDKAKPKLSLLEKIHDQDETNNPVERAQDYVSRGWVPIPIPFEQKSPDRRKMAGWEKITLDDPELLTRFPKLSNIGVVLGQNSSGLVDIDLDNLKAVALARYFLPPTATFGRKSNPASHWLYQCLDPSRTIQFKIPGLDEEKKEDKAMLVEFRSTGGQTVFPGSSHVSGEAIEWTEGRAPDAVKVHEIDGAQLLYAVGRLSAATLLALHWKHGARHDMTMALAGGLLQDRWSKEDVVAFISAIESVSDGPDIQDRLNIIESTQRRINDGDPVKGWGALVEHVDALCVTRIQAWLGTSGKPKVIVAMDEMLTNDAAVDALTVRAPDLGIYQRSGEFVELVRRDGVLSIRRISRERLHEMLYQAADFQRWVKKECVPCKVPKDMAGAILSRGNWPRMRGIKGVVTAPVLRRDGSLLDAPGYDEASQLYYDQPEDEDARVVLAPNPSKADAERAYVGLMEPVGEFPFATPAAKSAYLASILTPIALDTFDGPSPLFLMESSMKGSGKTLLASCATTIATGIGTGVLPYTRNEEELEKKILSIALAGQRTMMFDNLKGMVDSSTLEAALTSADRMWSGRRLGQSDQLSVPLNVVFYATGNNVELSEDLNRRCLTVRLQPLDENHDRKSFKISNLQAYVKRNRAVLYGHALTILRAYFAAGKPAQSLMKMGSFDGWSEVVCGAIVWLGLPDPVSARERHVEDPAYSLGAILIDILKQVIQTTKGRTQTTDILNFLRSNHQQREAFLEHYQTRNGDLPSTHLMGGLLRRYIKRPFGNFYISPDTVKQNNSQCWTVKEFG